MKNFYFLRFAVLLAFSAFLASSCSKDSLLKPQANNPNSMNLPTINAGDNNQTGSILALAPPVDYSISVMAFNDDYTSQEVFVDQNGVALLDDLPKGIYTVVARAHTEDFPKDFEDIYVKEVIVIPGEVTEIIISFPE